MAQSSLIRSEGVFDLLLGGWSSGRMSRTPFFWTSGLTILLFVVLSVWLGLSGGISNHLVLYTPFAALLFIVLLNISAKRWRDIGVPAWPTTITSVVASISMAIVLPGYVAVGFLFLLAFLLLLIPSHRNAE